MSKTPLVSEIEKHNPRSAGVSHSNFRNPELSLESYFRLKPQTNENPKDESEIKTRDTYEIKDKSKRNVT